ncbi:hypothetical protein GDO81_008048 [Engystomops pustulosus]|uniref:Secreted protein n=1 Tax=Engystomops pustulosus TaxID=76066 RepID=A0AAV7CE49_ENGPU|nr:hypothetical protein GDO81_008048 [Engystomops pustulosus]
MFFWIMKVFCSKMNLMLSKMKSICAGGNVGSVRRVCFIASMPKVCEMFVYSEETSIVMRMMSGCHCISSSSMISCAESLR